MHGLLVKADVWAFMLFTIMSFLPLLDATLKAPGCTWPPQAQPRHSLLSVNWFPQYLLHCLQ